MRPPQSTSPLTSNPGTARTSPLGCKEAGRPEEIPPVGTGGEGKSPLHRWVLLLKDSGEGWIADDAMRMSASLSYYAVFSIAPLMMIIIFLAGLVFGEEAARGQIAGQVADLVGREAGEAIESTVASTGQARDAGIAATVASAAIMLFGASTVFADLKYSLNTIWGVTVRPGRPVSALIRDRFLSFSLILCIGLLLLISLAVSTAVSALNNSLTPTLPNVPAAWQGLDLILSFVVTWTLFAMIFKILPNVMLRWRDVLMGAAITAVLFTVGKSAIAWYLGTSAVASSFGAAGSVIIILLWVYYASCIVFFGAEFTKRWVLGRGGAVIPNRHAEIATVFGGERNSAPPDPAKALSACDNADMKGRMHR